MQHRRTKWVWIDWFFSDVWKWECYTDVRDSKTSPEPHCRVLPPGKFNRRITEPLPIWKKVSRESLRHFSRNVANKHSCKQSCKHTRSKTTATQAINNITNLTLYGHIKTAEQRTIIQQYGDWYTGRWGVGPPSPLLAVPNVTAHPSTTSVPTSYYLMWHYNCLWILTG